MSVTPYYRDDLVTLYHGDCIEVMRALPDSSVDAVVTDPPYGLEFMGKEWDSYAPKDRKNASVWDGRRQGQEGWEDAAAARSGKGGGGPSYKSSHKGAKRCTLCGKRAFSGSPCECPEPEWVVEHRQEAPSAMIGFQKFSEAWAREAYRVLKPGGHLLAAGSTRTYHRLACAVEDAGFEIRDAVLWVHGQGFPKNLNVTAAIESQIAPDARCACAPRSSQTTPGSQGGYPSSHDSDDGQPPAPSDSGRSSAPSPDDARGRSRDGRRSDAPAPAPANTSPDAANGLPSSGSSAHPDSRSPLSPSGESLPSDTGTSTSTALDSEPRRTRHRTPSTSGLAAGSASLSEARYEYMACSVCGKIVVPQGLGTALKPATEIFVVARKPLIGTVAANVLAHGTGALNVDGCRVGTEEVTSSGWTGMDARRAAHGTRPSDYGGGDRVPTTHAGRWPANVILDESQAEALDRMSGVTTTPSTVTRGAGGQHGTFSPIGRQDDVPSYGDTGGASRFFYTAKADSSERPRVDGVAHPTVKPLDLMRYLVRLVTPPGGVVLEPFAGSGTTLEACIVEGFSCIGIEREADYLPLIMQRISKPIEVTLL